MTATTKFNRKQVRFSQWFALALGASIAAFGSLTPLFTPAASAYPRDQAKTILRQAYCRVLERPVDEDGLITFGSRLLEGMTAKELVWILATSEEHKSRFLDDSTDRDYIIKLYDHLLGRKADSGGIRTWMRALQNEGADQVVRGIMDSPEYQQKFGTDKVPGEGRDGCK